MNRFSQAEERISKLEINYLKLLSMRRKKMKKKEQSLKDLCDISNGTIYVSWESLREEKKKKFFFFFLRSKNQNNPQFEEIHEFTNPPNLMNSKEDKPKVTHAEAHYN